MSDDISNLIRILSERFPNIEWEVHSTYRISGHNNDLGIVYTVTRKMGGWLAEMSSSHFVRDHNNESAVTAVSELEKLLK